jgi:SAM-dependent methyltransferase
MNAHVDVDRLDRAPRLVDDLCLCGRPSSASRFLFRVNGAEVYRCSHCGLGRAQVRDFDAASYYASGYFDGGHADGYADYAGSESALRAEFSRTVQYLRRFVTSGQLLEVGCAFGYFLKEAQPFFDARGVEISSEAVARCRAAGLDVRQGKLERGDVEASAKVDVAVMLDVIEHLEDPRAVLALVAEALKPGGVVLITTGDFGSAGARLLGRRWRLMTPPQHLWFFTVRSIAELGTSLGLELVSADHPWKRVPLSLIEFQLKRMLGIGRFTRGLLPSSACLPVNLFDALRVVLRKPMNRAR